jgi:Metallo-peptidase family M12/Secretion system C-terminal sorting domain
MGQSEFSEKGMSLSSQNDTRLKKNFKAYKYYELSLKDIKALIRNKKFDKSKPIQFTLQLDNDKIAFNLFENDIFADSYCEIENGIKKTKDKIEINTYAGFIGDDSQNALRLFISENRISGFFTYNNNQYVIRNLSDYGIYEKNNPNKVEVIISKMEDEISNLTGMTCGNSNSIKGGRITAGSCPTYPATCNQFPTCKFVNIIVASDYEFYQRFGGPNGSNSNQTVATAQAVIIDFVNRIEFIMLRDLGLRLKLVIPPIISPNSNDGFPDNVTINGTTVPLINVQSALNLYGSTNVITNAATSAGVTLNSGVIRYYLSGKGFYSSSDNYGQSDQCSLCGYGGQTPQAINSIFRNSTNTAVSYSDAYLTMAHEIGHVLGANHDNNTKPSTIMDDVLGKAPNFSTPSKTEVNCYLSSQGSCISSNSVTSGFSNFMTLKLNGVNTSTPMFINKNTKTLAIADNPPYVLQSSNFTKNDSRVITYSTSLTQTQFSINTAPSFTMSVSAADKCNTYLSNVLFIYSAGGLRLAAEVYPNPSDGSFTLDDVSEDTSSEVNDITKIQVISEQGEFLKEIVYEKEKQKTIKVNELKQGIYYLKVIRVDGQIETKRIKIEH